MAGTAQGRCSRGRGAGTRQAGGQAHGQFESDYTLKFFRSLAPDREPTTESGEAPHLHQEMRDVGPELAPKVLESVLDIVVEHFVENISLLPVQSDALVLFALLSEPGHSVKAIT